MEKLLNRVVELLEEINAKLSRIEEKMGGEGEINLPSSIDLLTKMTKAQRLTYFAVQKIGEATCSEVAKETGRSMNLESRYLRRLYEIGVLGRKRVPVSDKEEEWKGTEVKYFIKEEI
ncbi:MAG: hypothetical protein ACTSVB_09065 [Candidatus Heimdallarchaeaceae archaeon]